MDVMDVTNVTDERDVVLSYSLIVTSSRRHFVTSSRRPPIPP